MVSRASRSVETRPRELVGSVLGLRIDEGGAASLDETLRGRMHAVGLGDLDRYASLLASSSSEIGELARHLCVNETYVLRHVEQFRVLERWLRERAGQGRPLRMLSAGCSTGDEAFSLAIVAHRALAHRDLARTSIAGVDIDPGALSTALAGRLSKWSLRDVPVDLRARYFTQAGRGHQVASSVRDMVEFRQENLVGPPTETWRPRSWHVVFCRNVLMYLTPEAASLLLARIGEALVDDGLLFLGHAETLRGLSVDFELRDAPGTFYYRRLPRTRSARAAIAHPAPTPTRSDLSWEETIAAAAERIEVLSRRAAVPVPVPTPVTTTGTTRSADRQRAMSLFQEERFAEALDALGPPKEVSREPDDAAPDAALMRAVLLANGGRLDEAERECDAMLAGRDLDPCVHYLKALCREQADDTEAALRHDRIAAYLDPAFALAHLHAGLLLRRRGETEAARTELCVAGRLLDREEPRKIALFGGGFGRQALIDLCRSELRACGGPA